MVTAIFVTAIFIYFFFYSRKLKKEQHQSWLQIGSYDQTEGVEGIITQAFMQKKKYAGHLWYVQWELNVYIEREKEKIKVIWKKPLTDHLNIPKLSKNQFIKVTGLRKHDIFYADEINAL